MKIVHVCKLTRESKATTLTKATRAAKTTGASKATKNNVPKTTTIMDINYETNSSFPIFSPVEHPLPPFPPQSMLKTPRTFLDPSPTLNKRGDGDLQ